MEGLGEKLVEQLVKKNLVKTVVDLYKLKLQDLVELERMADISAGNVIAAIQKSKSPALAKFIYALGIPEVGETTAKDLARFFRDIENNECATAHFVIRKLTWSRGGQVNFPILFGKKEQESG